MQRLAGGECRFFGELVSRFVCVDWLGQRVLDTRAWQEGRQQGTETSGLLGSGQFPRAGLSQRVQEVGRLGAEGTSLASGGVGLNRCV